MSADRDRASRVRDAFDALADLSTLEREGPLARLAAEAPEVAYEVGRLLGNDPGDAAIRDVVGSVAAEYQDPGLVAGQMIGAYRLVEEIGRGGMGTVWLAVRIADGYRAEVAIKLLRGATDSHLYARFKAERQILATLDHPCIARLLDVGTTPDGSPFVVMEYVSGEPIDEYCIRNRLSVDLRLELFGRVCSAVQYAHRNLVVHRDLKPGNILVDAEGVPKLLDFGIAKLLDASRFAESILETRTGSQLLTPRFASPEQIRGEPITTASDVYSLGVLLHVLLTGETPYRLTTPDPIELARAVCEHDPTLPSQAVRRPSDDELTDDQDQDRERLARRLEGDIDNIVAKALRKEPGQRYASPEELAEDLRRHLDRLPVSARAPTLRYRLGRFASRHRWRVAGVAAIVATVTGAGLFSVAQMRVALDASETAERVALQQALRATFAAVAARIDAGDAEGARDLLDAVEPADRGWAWRYLRGRIEAEVVATVASDAIAAGFGADAQSVLSVTGSGTLRRWSLLDGSEESVSPLGSMARVRHAAVSTDGTHAVLVHGDDGDRVALWALAAIGGGAPNLLFDESVGAEVSGVALSHTGASVVATGVGQSWVWQGGTAGAATVPGGTGSRSVSVSADGTTAVFVDPSDGGFWVIDLERPAPVARRQGRSGVGVAVAPDGRVLAGGDIDRMIRIHEVGAGRSVMRLPGHRDIPEVLAYSLDGSLLASAASGEIRLWAPGEGTLLWVHSAPAPVRELRFSADGRLLTSVSDNGAAVVWRTRPRERETLGGRAVAAAAGGDRFRSVTQWGEIRSYDFSSGELFDRFDAQATRTTGIASSADDAWLAVLEAGRVVLRPTANPGAATSLPPGSAEVVSVAFSPAGPRLATLDRGGEVRLVEAGSWVEIARMNGSPVADGGIAFSPDGARLVTVHADGARIWDPTGAPIDSLFGEGRAPTSAVYGPDGTRLAVGWSDGAVSIHGLDGRSQQDFEPHRAAVTGLAYAPGGQRVASGAADGSVRLLDIGRGAWLLELGRHASTVRSLTFSGDGATLASADEGGDLRLWDGAEPGVRGLAAERLAAARREVADLVARTVSESPVLADAAQSVRVDPSLEGIHRQAALQLLLESPVVETGLVGDPFDGFAIESTTADSYVLIGDDDALRMTDAFTVELWAQPSPEGAADGALIGKEGEYTFGFIDGAAIQWIVADPGGWDYPWRQSRQRVRPGAWAHVALVRDGATMRFFVNGRLVHDQPGPVELGDHEVGMNELRIAGRQGAPLSPRARVDEVRLWNVARSGDEIRGSMYSRVRGDEPGLLAGWSFDEGSGDVARDVTGRFHGQLVGARWSATRR